MNFGDVIKKSVLEGFSYADMSTGKIITTLVITFLIALYIFQVYRVVSKGAFYFKNFNVSMAIISVVTQESFLPCSPVSSSPWVWWERSQL